MKNKRNETSRFVDNTIGLVVNGNVNVDVAVTWSRPASEFESDEARAARLRSDREAHLDLMAASRQCTAWTSFLWGMASAWCMSKLLTVLDAAHLNSVDKILSLLLVVGVPLILWFTIPRTHRHRYWAAREDIKAVKLHLRHIEEELRPLEARSNYRAKCADRNDKGR